MRKALAVVALLLLPLSADAAPKKRAKIVEGIVATVGERCIMLSDVRKRVATLPEAARTAQALEAELEKMIDAQLVEIDIERTKLGADSGEIDARISADAKKAGMSDAQFLESLEKRGIKRTEHRDATAKAIAAEKWDERVVRPKLKPGEDLAAGRARLVRELRASYDVEVLL
jgi:parvulin-like peptidyl-prolyl isomerase